MSKRQAGKHSFDIHSSCTQNTHTILIQTHSNSRNSATHTHTIYSSAIPEHSLTQSFTPFAMLHSYCMQCLGHSISIQACALTHTKPTGQLHAAAGVLAVLFGWTCARACTTTVSRDDSKPNRQHVSNARTHRRNLFYTFFSCKFVGASARAFHAIYLVYFRVQYFIHFCALLPVILAK